MSCQTCAPLTDPRSVGLRYIAWHAYAESRRPRKQRRCHDCKRYYWPRPKGDQ